MTNTAVLSPDDLRADPPSGTDARALFTQHFDAARTALTEGDNLAAAECLRWAIVAARTDPSLRRELASALFHLGRLSRRFGQAGEAEAEQLLTEALAISEGLLGMEHAALAPLLNELGRLHVQRAQHARAEAVLERLLAMGRVKGEENTDVAVALAGLAGVKRKLGDNASAEALYRDALRIREKVLEPNHMVTVATLEQLSETCAARGNLTEALALLQRALPTREVVLGPSHATVRAARSRVAELELQAAIAADTAAAAAARAARGPIPTPAWVKGTPESAADAPPTAASPWINAKDLEFLGEPATGDGALGDWHSTIAPVQAYSPEPAHKKRTVLYASAGVAAVAIATAGLLMLRPRAGGASDPVSAELSAPQRTTAAVTPVVMVAERAGSIATGAAAMVGATRADLLRSTNATPAPTALVVRPEQRAPQSAPREFRAPRVEINLGPMNLPSIPATNVDSIMRSATERQRASDTDRIATEVRLPPPTPAGVDDAPTPPKIIGHAPVPRYPNALLRSVRSEGEVVVRFEVDELGSVDVASMIVLRSDHELLTAAVRDILPLFRFEPARTHSPESKPVAAWVTVPFRFTTKK